MKKNLCKLIATMLAILMVSSVFVVMPAMAATAKSYDISATTETITIDGKADEAIWTAVSSEQIVNDTANSRAASFKTIWTPCEDDDTKINVYFLVSVQGYIGYSYRNSTQIQIQNANGTEKVWTSGGDNINKLHEATKNASINYTSYQAGAVRALGATAVSVIEYAFTMNKTDEILFDIKVSWDDSATSTAVVHSWAGMTTAGNDFTPTGVGNIGNLAIDNCNIVTTAGASIRIDTANKSKSGIRFETKVDANAVNALISKGAKITTGTLVLPTDFLAAKSIADEDFTIEGLNAAGLVEGTHYYNIVNENNEWVEGSDGAWYGTLYDIKNFTREFSGVGYITIEIYGETVTYYGGYAIDNARSIAGVAETLMDGEVAGDDGNWTAAQEEVLLGFYKAEA